MIKSAKKNMNIKAFIEYLVTKIVFHCDNFEVFLLCKNLKMY